MVSRIIESTLIIKHQEYKDALDNSSSGKFRKLKEEVENGLNGAFCDDMPPYAQCKVTVKNFRNFQKISSENMRSIFNSFQSEKIPGIIVNYEIQVKILECNVPRLHDSLTLQAIAIQKYPHLEIGEYSELAKFSLETKF